MTAPAGWYPQPDGSEGFWDGRSWTGQRPPAGPQDLASATLTPAAQPYAVNAYAVATPYAVAPKSPGLALLVSFFIPGVGSMMNGDVGKGVGILLLYLIGLPLCLIAIGVPIILGTWIWGMLDAYIGANNYNRRHGIIG